MQSLYRWLAKKINVLKNNLFEFGGAIYKESNK